MSKAKLKKYLQTLSKEQVIEVMLELYDARKEAKDYLEFYLTPDSNAELEKCKKAIRQEFFPNRGFSEKPSFAKCRKVISDFQKLKPDPNCVADLMLFYIEQGCEYTVTFGDMWEQCKHSKKCTFYTLRFGCSFAAVNTIKPQLL